MVPTVWLADGFNEGHRQGESMIRNDEELTAVRNQLALIEDALAALRRDVLPKNRRNYEVLSEGYVDQIAALRAEIDAYLGLVTSSTVDGRPDGVVVSPNESIPGA